MPRRRLARKKKKHGSHDNNNKINNNDNETEIEHDTDKNNANDNYKQEPTNNDTGTVLLTHTVVIMVINGNCIFRNSKGMSNLG